MLDYQTLTFFTQLIRLKPLFFAQNSGFTAIIAVNIITQYRRFKTLSSLCGIIYHPGNMRLKMGLFQTKQWGETVRERLNIRIHHLF